MRRCCFRTIFLLLFFLTVTTTANASEKIKFGVPPWPGVTVKSHVITQILEVMGYENEMLEVGPPIIYKSMTQNDMDICLAGWTPQQNPMLDPLLKEKKVVLVRPNLEDAMIGLCVSEEAWKGGVKSIGDLHKYAKKFDKTIYDIEAGSGMHTAMEGMLANNVGQLGGWEHMASTTPIMLAEAASRIKSDKWVVFGCWKPHWMTIRMNIRFLEPIPGSEELVSESKVYTITRTGFGNDYPQIQKLLDNFVISSEVQSEWINEFSYKNIPADEVAAKWIAANIDQVENWLKDVKTADGKNAIDAVRAKYSK